MMAPIFWRIIISCGLVLLVLSPLCGADEPARPNILFIRTDDQARWAVGFNGNREIQTPHIDRLHREGASFSNAFVTTPVCSPSRVAMLTGLHGVQAGITDYIRPKDTHGIRAEFVTWPEALQKAGYVTGIIGKWHLGNTPEHHPTNHGFNYFMGFVVGGRQPLGPQLEIYGVDRKLPGVWLTDFLGDDAVHFIRMNRHTAFVLDLDFRSPHAPYAPETPADTALYADADLTIPDFPGINRERCRRLTREYYASITAVDRNVGKLLDLLDELNIASNTIVIFTSDHGYMLGHHGLWHKGNAVYFDREGVSDANRPKDPEARRPNMFDDSIRVPLAIRWPARIKPGTVIEAPVLQIDFHPTLLAVAGVPMPELPESQRVQGMDFSPFLAGGTLPWRTEVFGDYDMIEGKKARMRMVRTADWKLVKHYEEEGGEDELFDLRADPGETKNLYQNPPDPKVLQNLERRLIEWQEKIGDPLLASGEFKRRQAEFLN